MIYQRVQRRNCFDVDTGLTGSVQCSLGLIWFGIKQTNVGKHMKKKKYNCMNYFILGWIWFVFYNEPTVKRQHQTTLFKRHPLYTFAEKEQTCLNVLYVLLNPTHCTFK